MSAEHRVHQSFLAVGRYRHALMPCAGALACIAAYACQPREQVANGGTRLGLTLGTIATVLILILMGYGIRRRSFHAKVGSAARWLSLHVYLGLCALLVASLHCGFSFGRNIHTITYGLLCAVVASGCWGVYAYVRYPALLVKVRGNGGRNDLLRQLTALDLKALVLANSLSPAHRDLVADAIRRTRIGGHLVTQLAARDESRLLLAPPFESGCARLVGNAAQRRFIAVLTQQYATGTNPKDREALDQLLRVTGIKAVVQRKLQRDIQLQGLMQLWLYAHLPLSFGLLAALGIHIISVFFYR